MTKPIRKVFYTTNSIEAVHRQFRKLTKTKGAFRMTTACSNYCTWAFKTRVRNGGPAPRSALGTMPIQNWNLTLSQLAIFFEGRLDGALDL